MLGKGEKKVDMSYKIITFAPIIGGSVVATIWLDKMSGAPGYLVRSFFVLI